MSYHAKQRSRNKNRQTYKKQSNSERVDDSRKEWSSRMRGDEAQRIHRGFSQVNRKYSARRAIRDHGGQLVPMYQQFRTYKPDAITTEGKRRKQAKENARQEFTRSRRQTGDFNRLSPAQKKQLQIDAGLCASAYVGFGTESRNKHMPSGYRVMPQSRIPKHLRNYYDHKTGLLNLPSGLDALIVEGPDGLTIALRGTEPTSKNAIAADVIQRLGGFSPMYQDAAGVVDALLQDLPEQESLRVTGHSLGGGLAQFATTANLEKYNGRISASCFNSAGLSSSTLGALEGKIEKSQEVISHVRVEGDSVSPESTDGEYLKGSLVGEVMTLPKPDNILLSHPAARECRHEKKIRYITPVKMEE